MKKFVATLLCCLLFFSGCAPRNSSVAPSQDENVTVQQTESIDFPQLNDPELLTYIEDDIYDSLIDEFADEDYFIENVEAIYISDEYLEELAYNSQENIFFGYTLSELNAQFQGTKYVFTLGEDGKTIVTAFEEYDDTYEQVIKNVAVGTGVILVCVTVSVATAGTAPAVSAVLAVSAKTGTVVALSDGAISAVIAGTITGIQTGDMEEVKRMALIEGSEGFKWGAIAGVITGGASKFAGLKGGTLGGLSLNEAALIQKESKYPIEVIKQFKTTSQYNICRNASLRTDTVLDKTALVRDIDLDFKSKKVVKGVEIEQTNIEWMKDGYAPIEPNTGMPYELHHLGQKKDSTLVILTKAEHMKDGNNRIWHTSKKSEIHCADNDWDSQREDFWKDFARQIQETMQ